MAENQDRDQRTENATPQRIQKAREEGQIGFSPEFVGGVMVATGVLLTCLFGKSFFATLGNSISYRLTYFQPMIEDPRMLVGAVITDVEFIGMACIAFIVPMAVIAGLSGLLQTSFNISFKPLQLDWNKLSVMSGIGRIFSSKSAVRGGLSIVKAAIIVCIFYFIAKSKLDVIAVAGFGSFRDLMFFMCETLLYASIAIAAMMVIVGMIDLAYQKWKHLQDMKMSLRDIKDENKESEGDPLIRPASEDFKLRWGANACCQRCLRQASSLPTRRTTQWQFNMIANRWMRRSLWPKALTSWRKKLSRSQRKTASLSSSANQLHDSFTRILKSESQFPLSFIRPLPRSSTLSIACVPVYSRSGQRRCGSFGQGCKGLFNSNDECDDNGIASCFDHEVVAEISRRSRSAPTVIVSRIAERPRRRSQKCDALRGRAHVRYCFTGGFAARPPANCCDHFVVGSSTTLTALGLFGSSNS